MDKIDDWANANNSCQRMGKVKATLMLS